MIARHSIISSTQVRKQPTLTTEEWTRDERAADLAFASVDRQRNPPAFATIE
jgi:hypothetical protein